MNNSQDNPRLITPLAVMAFSIISLMACSNLMAMNGSRAKRPADSEFGLGPRTSANRLYVATIEPSRELKPRQMMSVLVKVTDEAGVPVEGATLTIDGGMPQHGHGLPTRPRMTRTLTSGTYEIEGVRFNMGGWWEFKVTIATERGADTVTFNLTL
jgi:hypothetical protein